MDEDSEDPRSYFSAAGGPTGLTAQLAELETLRQSLAQQKQEKPNVIIPQTGAGQYWYVDPRAQQTPQPPSGPPFNPMTTYQGRDLTERDRAERERARQYFEEIGVLPANAPNILMRNPYGNAPRLADERGDLLREIDNTIYGGPPPAKPSPTPTPPRLYPTSYFA